MRKPRIYHSGELAVGVSAKLDDAASAHLARVLKAKPDQTVELFNGDGFSYAGTITTISKSGVSVSVDNKTQLITESPLNIHLGQVISRGDKMDLTIQKSVELGVAAITPLFSERCGVRLSGARLEKKCQHWQKVIISACEQCQRNTIPPLHPPIALSLWLKQNSQLVCLLMDTQDATPLSDIVIENGQALSILVGPEGGFSDQELALAHEHKAISVRLGPRILRTETAALSLLAVLQYIGGDFSRPA